MKYGINQFLYLEVVHLHCRLTVPSMPDIYKAESIVRKYSGSETFAGNQDEGNK